MEKIMVPGYTPPDRPVKKIKSAGQLKIIKEKYQDIANQEAIAMQIKEHI